MAKRRRPSALLRLGFKVPVWVYQVGLGFLFAGRVVMIVHHGRKSGRRYVSGLEVLVRREGELFAFSAWGTRADWYRNVEAGGVDGLWDGRTRHPGASFRLLAADEAYSVLQSYETEHAATARRTLPRMLDGYDFGDQKRRQLAESGTVVGFRPLSD